MKTTQLFLASLVCIGLSTKLNAQATTANTTNTVTSTAYLGSGSTSNFDVQFKRNNVPAGKLATTFTNFGVNSLAMPNSVSIGVGAGQFSSGTGFNTYIGQNAGKGNSATVLNSGIANTYIGNKAGETNSSGSSNVAIGNNASLSNSSGSGNVAIGAGAGQNNSTGSYNTFVGTGATTEEINFGSRNVFIGAFAGYTESEVSNRLVIGNDESNQLIWGDFALSQLKLNGKVGIGTDALTHFGNFPTAAATVNVANYNLFVKGGILTEEVRVSLASTWADYVFAKDYNLKPLSEVEHFINTNGHLPNVPSAKQVKEEGVELGEMAKIQQEKIEELTLYVIEQNKINESQAKEIEVLKAQMKAILERQ